MATIKRVITITLEIDTETHSGKTKMQVRENGKAKKEFTPAQAVTTARALTLLADELLGLTMEPLLALDMHRNENGDVVILTKK